MNRREIDLETRQNLVNLVELVMLMDTKIDILLEKINEAESSESDKKKSKLSSKK